MSKRSLFWGQASGKLGEAVYYRAGGEQRTRAWVPKIKNPKTLAQVENRLSMLNLVTTYKLWQAVLKGAFPLKKSNQSDYNAFVSANKNADTAVMTMGMKEAGLAMPVNMRMAAGDLPITTSVSRREVETLDGTKWATVISGLQSSDATFTEEEAAQDPTSVELHTADLVYRALVGTNNPNNLPAEFKVFIISGALTAADSALDPIDVFGFKPVYSYITAKAGSDEEWTQIGRGGYPRLFGVDLTVTGEAPNQIYSISGLSVDMPTEKEALEDAAIYAVVISYTDGNGKQKVNTAIMSGIVGAAPAFFDAYRPGGEVYQAALTEMGYNANNLLATK